MTFDPGKPKTWIAIIVFTSRSWFCFLTSTFFTLKFWSLSASTSSISHFLLRNLSISCKSKFKKKNLHQRKLFLTDKIHITFIYNCTSIMTAYSTLLLTSLLWTQFLSALQLHSESTPTIKNTHRQLLLWATIKIQVLLNVCDGAWNYCNNAVKRKEQTRKLI